MRKVLYVLGQLADADVEWLIAHGARQRPPAGTVLIREGQPIDVLYFLLDGDLEVSFAGPGGRQTVRLGCGEVVGEMSFVDSRPPSATVTVAAPGPAVVLAVPRAQLEAQLEKDPAFAARFYRAVAVLLSDRLRSTVSRLAYGHGEPLSPGVEYEGELCADVLERAHLAGSRFDRILRRLLAD
jgi:bacteriocin-type transport-associated protein